MLRHCAVGTSDRSSTARRLESTSRETCYAQGSGTREWEANNEHQNAPSLPPLPRSLSLSDFTSFSCNCAALPRSASHQTVGASVRTPAKQRPSNGTRLSDSLPVKTVNVLLDPLAAVSVRHAKPVMASGFTRTGALIPTY